MPIRTVRYLSEAKAIEMQPSGNNVLFSIANPGQDVPLTKNWPAILRYHFVDTEYDRQSLQFAWIDWWEASGAFGPAIAIRMRSDIKNIHASALPIDLVVNCHAGESRSAAVAEFVAKTYGARLDQGCSRKANKTVLGLLQNPWRDISEDAYKGIRGPILIRWRYRIRKYLGSFLRI